MGKNSRNFLLIVLVVMALVTAGAVGFWRWQGDNGELKAQIEQLLIPSKRTPPKNPPEYKMEIKLSGECGVCGSEGIHNVNGAACAPGLECKKGLITSFSYCVKPDTTVEICEKSQ